MNKDIKYYKGTKGIYKLRIGEKEYIGSSKDIYGRIRSHFSSLNSGKHHNKYLQRCYDKYKVIDVDILWTCDSVITELELLQQEKRWIELINPVLNLKLDPVSQKRCKTTCKKVHQFDMKGNLIKVWSSVIDAAEFLKVDASGITVSCKNPKRQRVCANFLWSYDDVCDTSKMIYVYQYDKYVGSYGSTSEICDELFPYKVRKLVLSRVNAAAFVNGTYCDYTFTFDKDFLPIADKTIYKKDKLGNILETHKLSYLNSVPRKERNIIWRMLKNEIKSYGGYCWSYDDQEKFVDKRVKMAGPLV